MTDSGYVLATFPFALASFIVLVTGISLGVGLAVIWVGLPILAGVLIGGRAFARLERLRLSRRGTVVTEVPLELPTRQWPRILATLRNKDLWREALHGVLALPVSILTWSLTLAWWAMVIGGLTGWIWENITHHYGAEASGAGPLMRLLGWPLTAWQFDLIVGVVSVLTLPWVVRACASMQAGLGRALLSQDRESLESRVEQLSQARDQLSKAEAVGLRRVERDLHDGPQQSLIRLGMDLASAQRRLAEGDVAAAAELLDQTRHLNDSVIADLRALSRNIAPPVLAERGLAAALTAVAATSPIPVSLRYTLIDEPDEATATAAYFVACEALANAIKYSRASQINITVGLQGAGRLALSVADDGIGGAVSIPGHGLAGLSERIAALDGRLTVGGPPGTTVTAVLPVSGTV